MFGVLNDTDEFMLGSTPCGEECAQVGCDNYTALSMEECRQYKKQLEAAFPERPKESRFVIKGFPHDFGMYYEVIVRWDLDSEEAERYAFNVESNLPELWQNVESNPEEKPEKILTATWVGGEEGALQSDLFGDGCSIQCPYCQMDRQMESDASGLCECEGCSKTFIIEPLC